MAHTLEVSRTNLSLLIVLILGPAGLAIGWSAALPAPAIAAPVAVATGGEEVIDLVVASVNGNPITLQDVANRLHPPRRLSFEKASSDPEVRATLDALILERLIREEAEARKIGVSTDEIERYIDEVAKRNNLSREGFERAVVEMGSTMDEYRHQVETEILRGRLTSAYLKGGVTVTEEEITEYLDRHGSTAGTGARIGLRQIVIDKSAHGPEEAGARLAKAQQELAEGRAFAEVAADFSDGPNARDGGMLGLVPEADLSAAIFDAVFYLKPDEVSKPLEDEHSYQLFQVTERLGAEGSATRARQEAREVLQRQKLETGVQAFFQGELYKRYAVDKKI